MPSASDANLASECYHAMCTKIRHSEHWSSCMGVYLVTVAVIIAKTAFYAFKPISA